MRGKVHSEIDNSLRGNAMRRALRQELPKTLTPYEWERWYAEHGVPEEHIKAKQGPKPHSRGMGSWLAALWKKRR